MIIHGATLAVSIYLGFTLTNHIQGQDDKHFLVILAVLMIVAILSSSIGKLISNKIFLSISANMHARMVKQCLGTNITFFEENTCGLIINRFSKDVKELDNFLFTFLQCTDYIVKCLFSSIIIIYRYPVLLLLAVGQIWYLKRLRHLCMCATRDTIRLKFSLMSSVYTLIQDSLNGLPTLKCMDQIGFFMK